MNLFVKFYLEMILIILIGLLMNPTNDFLKINLFFILFIWSIFHFFTIKNLFYNSKLVENLILESEENEILENTENKELNVKVDKSFNKFFNFTKKYYLYFILLCILILFTLTSYFFAITGIIFFCVELIKLIKINSIIKSKSITSN